MKIPVSLLLLFIFTIACNSSPDPIDPLTDVSFTLLNQDSVAVNFPGDYEGKTIIMGFVYTNCPDICPLITGNMKKIQQEMGNPDDVAFVGLSFDPARDTPYILKNYHGAYGLNEKFDFLTGDTTVVAQLLEKLKVRTQISFSTTTDDGRELYFMNHSDKLIVLNDKGEWIYEYGGSMTPTEYIIEDIGNIR